MTREELLALQPGDSVQHEDGNDYIVTANTSGARFVIRIIALENPAMNPSEWRVHPNHPGDRAVGLQVIALFRKALGPLPIWRDILRLSLVTLLVAIVFYLCIPLALRLMLR